MATPLRMPDLGTVEGDVILVRWLKAEGDTVALGEPLFEVETDKGVSEVEAAMAGVLLRKVIAEGAKAGSGETIALIRRPGEPEESVPPAAEMPRSTVAAAPQMPPGTVAPQMPPRTVAPQMPPRTVAPVIRALAEKWGVDLAAIRATGPGGRITREDVLRAKGGGAPQSARPSAATILRGIPAPAATVSGGISASAVPLSLSHGQAIVARKVSQSHREKPVYRVNALVDMSRAISLREKGKAGGTAIGWDALFVKAAAMAVTEMPLFRRYFKGEDLMPRGTVAALAEHAASDIAVAVGIEDELFIPAVRGAAGKSIAAISREIEALAKKAETRALQSVDVEGSCFLVSNLGMFPIDSFDAIIYPDHSAALAVGATTPTPVSDGKNIWIAPMARLSLSVDHRLINGKTAARFLARVKQIVENGELG
jgi:pyruvate dehydrogenase E2 component (dihydrolipoamide acetyltransferase)